MEKFAVDLEKVLDEFEYNEEREENVPSSLIKSSPLPNLGSNRQQVPIRPPAASYRRPSFEPINLADADFAASPPKTSSSNLKLGISSRPVDNGTFSLSSSGPEVNNRNYFNDRNDNDVSSQDNEVNINKQMIFEHEDISSNNVWKIHPAIQTDEKPDLLEYNSKIRDFVSCELEIQNQLPDLTTSVRASNHAANNSQVDSISNSLDLISSTSGNLLPIIEGEGTSGNSGSIKELRATIAEEVYDNKTQVTKETHSELPLVIKQKDSSIYTKERFDSITAEEEETYTKFKRDCNAPVDVPLTEQNATDCNVKNQWEFDSQKYCDLYKLKETELVLDINGSSYLKNYEDTSDNSQSFESQKPIGFSADSDVSESDLEEYLKELEELDKTLEIEESNRIQSIKSLECERTVIESESKILNESSKNSNSADALNSEVVYSSITHYITTENQECEVESCERPTHIYNKEELLDSASNSCILRENSNKSNSLTSNEQDEITTQKTIGLHQTESTVSTTLLPGKEETIEVTVDAPRLDKQSAPKSNNPFDEGVEVEEEREHTKSQTEDYPTHISSIEAKEIIQNMNNSNSEVETPNKVKVNTDLRLETDASVSALNNLTSELKEQEFDSNQIMNEEDSAKHSSEDERGPTPIKNSDSSLENLPSCSGQQSGSLEGSVRMIPIKSASESPSTDNVDEAGVVADEERPPRPNSLELSQKITVEATSPQSPERPTGELVTELGCEDRRLGKIPPFWVPDTEANQCMQCQLKFTVIKRRHHCRACGQVLCYKCCGLKARLEYMNFAEARVCQPCFTILEAVRDADSSSALGRQPNPNNPMEYCSTIPPLQQAAGSMHQPPPSVMVPVGVLKREGRVKSEVTKQVMFSDGIRPGGDLTELDGSGEPRIPFRRPGRLTKRVGTPPGGVLSPTMRRVMDPMTHSFIPAEGDTLPPVVTRLQAEVSYSDLESPISLNQPSVKFAINRNLFVSVQRVMLDCCLNRESWCFCSEGLACVGQDEIVFLLECLPQETHPPKDVFFLINNLFQDAAKGSTVSEMSFTPTAPSTQLGSRDHGGFLYIRTSYQCTAQLSLPPPPYLVALLIHRWETPWARLFPLRLVLRLGAEFRYYPCPLVSVRNRPPLYTDIGHTIINILADFRKYSYTLPSVRGLVIHMEDRQTTINIPRNRYDQVVRALNNSNDSVLAFGANLSLAADSHLVCMQSSEDENTSYHTQAINIHNKPRKVTGASFVVFNGALKVPGLAGKSNIVEDGLMVQVPGETMTALRTALRDMRDYTVGCGPNAEETVVLQWTADDTNFNIGVKSCIDGKPLDGVPSIRVHNGTDYSGGTRIIRWTEVFILQCEDTEHTSEPVDVSRVSERIARATCVALVQLLDLLTAAGLTTLAVRATIHPDNVGYEAGSNGEKLPPLYMKSLDNELVAVVHQAALSSQENPAVLELVFRVMEQG